MEPKENKNLVFTLMELAKPLDSNEGHSTASEMAKLREKCLSSDASVGASAIHVLTTLAERGSLKIADGLSALISLVSSSKEMTPALIPAIGRLLLFDASRPDWKCPYDLCERPHPLVTILQHSWSAWDGVLAFLLNVFSPQTLLTAETKRAVIKPVVSSVIFDPAAPMYAKSSVVRLLVSAQQEELLFELLAFQQIDINWCWLVRDVVSECIEKEALKSIQWVEALTPSLAAALAWLVTRGHDPSLWINLLERCLLISAAPVDVVLFILAQIIPSCPTIHLLPIAELGKEIVLKEECSIYGASAVGAAMLRWALCVTQLTSGVTEKVRSILNILPRLKATSKVSELTENQLFLIMSNSSPVSKIALDLALLTNEWKTNVEILKWLRCIQLRQKNSPAIMHLLQPLLLAVELQAHSLQITKLILNILEEASRSDNTFAFPILCITLYKLSRETDPHLQLEYLKLVPQMAVDKENIPLILGTIESLNASDHGVMTPLRIILLLSLWSLQPRTFPYLYRLLLSTPLNSKKSWEIQVTRAVALLEISRRSPHTNGKEIVGLLSDVLNSSSDWSGSSASAFAVDAITQLCQADVIDVQGTWTALAPKMREEKRPAVAASLCRLLAVAADGSCDDTCSQAISRLWLLLENGCATDDALDALGHFPLHAFSLKSFPPRFKCNLSLPKNLVKADAPPLPEEVLDYVPGECWIQLLATIEENHVVAAEGMISRLLKGEVTGLPRGIYSLALGVSEPTSLAHLPQSSLLLSLVNFLQKKCRDKWSSSRLFLSVLRILSLDYTRPFPPLDWTFLRPGFSDPLGRGYVVKLCAQQGAKSPSAQKLLQEFIDLIREDYEATSVVSPVLPTVSQCVTTSSLVPVVDQMLREALRNVSAFTDAINAVRKTVALVLVPEATRIAVAKSFRSLLVDLPPDMEELDVVWECVAELPDAVVQKLTCSKHWPQVTSHRIRQALRVRRAAVTNKKCPLDAFAELIDIACSREEDQRIVLDEVVSSLRLTDSKSCRIWFRQLLTRLLATLSTNPITESLFLLRLVLLSVAVLSGCDLLLTGPQQLTLDENQALRLLPASLQILLANPVSDWSKEVPHVVEGLFRLSKWQELPHKYDAAVHQSLIALRGQSYCLLPPHGRWSRIFYRQNS